MHIAQIIYPGPTPSQFQENDYNNEHVEKSRNIYDELCIIMTNLGGQEKPFNSDSNGIITFCFEFEENKEIIIKEQVTKMFNKYNVPVKDNDQYVVNISVYEE
jgi:hypothetical protein